jgi:hypothetical protein
LERKTVPTKKRYG